MTWRRRLRPGLAKVRAYDVPRPEGLVRLDANESPEAPSDGFRARVADLVRGLELNRYPDPKATALKAALAAHHRADPREIVLGNGSDEVIALLVAAFAGPDGDGGPARVAFPVPTFSMYRLLAEAMGAEVLPLETAVDFTVDVDGALARLAAASPSLLFLARPNNPTGALWPRALVDGAAALEDTLVVVDEAYGDFAGETCRDLVPDRPNVVVLRTLSKVGFAGLRLGYALCHRDLAAELEKLRLPYNVDAFTQAVAAEVVARWDTLVAPAVARIVAERDRLAGAVAALGIPVFPSRANFLLLRVADPDGTFTALAGRGILVRNLHRTGTPLAGCLRVTVGTRAENDRLVEALEGIAS